jgi:hypothetical protein
MAVIDTLTFRCTDGVEERELLDVDRRVQTEFVPNLPGFVRRTTARAADGPGWIVVTLWESAAQAEAAEELAGGHDVVRALSALMDPATVVRARYLTLD